MKTAKEWLEELPPGYRERALRILPEDRVDLPCDGMSDALFAVRWSSSKEGFDFWNDVWAWAQGYNELPPLPQDGPTAVKEPEIVEGVLDEPPKRFDLFDYIIKSMGELVEREASKSDVKDIPDSRIMKHGLEPHDGPLPAPKPAPLISWENHYVGQTGYLPRVGDVIIAFMSVEERGIMHIYGIGNNFDLCFCHNSMSALEQLAYSSIEWDNGEPVGVSVGDEIQITMKVIDIPLRSSDHCTVELLAPGGSALRTALHKSEIMYLFQVIKNDSK